KDVSKHGGSDALSLMFGHDVQMVEKPVVLLRTNHDEAYAHAIDFDEATQRRVKGRQKAIPRALRVKAPCPLQALAHRLDANGDHGVRVRLRRGQESQIHAKVRHIAFGRRAALTSPPSSSASASPASEPLAARACLRSRRGAPR